MADLLSVLSEELVHIIVVERAGARPNQYCVCPLVFSNLAIFISVEHCKEGIRLVHASQELKLVVIFGIGFFHILSDGLGHSLDLFFGTGPAFYVFLEDLFCLLGDLFLSFFGFGSVPALHELVYGEAFDPVHAVVSLVLAPFPLFSPSLLNTFGAFPWHICSHLRSCSVPVGSISKAVFGRFYYDCIVV